MATEKKKRYESDSTDITAPAVLLGIDRPKPNNENAEVAVLGSILISREADAHAIPRLNFRGAFYRTAHQLIFDAIVAQNPKGDAAVDLIVLGNYLQKNNQLEQIGGLSYLQQLMNKVPTAANIEHYTQIVKDNAVLRIIIGTCSEAMLKCYEDSNGVNELLDSISQKLMEVSQMNQTKDFYNIQALVQDAMGYIMELLDKENNKVKGLATGYSTLDQSMTGGLKPGMLFILAARPSIGKTAMALNMAANIAFRDLNNPTPVGIFSLEMTAQQLVMRLISARARVNINRWAFTDTQDPKEIADVKCACEDLSRTQIYIDDTGGIDILELRAKARRMREEKHIEVLFIDYLTLINITSNRNGSRENDVSRISGSLKALAKELNIPIVCLAQLNRAAEQGDNAKPKLSNLRESGAIEQDADVVALLHRKREEQFNQANDSTAGFEAELIVAKNRSGRTCLQNLTFFPQYTVFDDRLESVPDDALPQS